MATHSSILAPRPMGLGQVSGGSCGTARGAPSGGSARSLGIFGVQKGQNSTPSPDSIPGLGRSPGEGNGKPLQYSCLENPLDRGAW